MSNLRCNKEGLENALPQRMDLGREPLGTYKKRCWESAFRTKGQVRLTTGSILEAK